ncbi:hypothetical protein HDE68_001225 [Pedobacter cryoconitis]|uniref:Uncharacterized protein n=1 Tax=Pedobacter cryoconitis TaxID=188932 RepID=A0A7W8ZK69_9SPHI|nr:hypothetical protein [Pedobacter cryoconitis]MBB5635340.1 hypothetical protein [Pedobacter cryoconitis]
MGKRKLDWDNAFLQSNGDTVAVFVPVKLDARITLVDGGLPGARIDNLLYLRLMTTSKAFDGSKAEMISMIPDQIWEKGKNFSGHMFIENWFSPNISVVSRTKNSTIPKNINSKNPGDKVVNGFMDCYTATETACVGAGGGETCVTNTTTVCVGGGGGNPGGGGGGGDGGGSTGTPGGAGGSGGGGGNGNNNGPKVLSPNIIININTRSCVGSIINQILNNYDTMISNSVADVAGIRNNDKTNAMEAIAYLQSLKTFTIGITEGTIEDKISTDQNGNILSVAETHGSTDPKTGNITLNSQMLNKATDLAVASTVIHELMHSYLVYGTQHLTGEQKMAFEDVNRFIFSPEDNSPISGGAAQHFQMASTYVESMAVILTNYAQANGIQSPDDSVPLKDYCEDIFWSSLQQSSGLLPKNPERSKKTGSQEFNNETKSTKKKGC